MDSGTIMISYKERIIHHIGNIDLLKKKKITLFCSIKCLGEIILKLHDFVQNITGTDIAVMSGFHSPVEKGVLDNGKRVWLVYSD